MLAGARPDALPDGHFFRADDARAGLWFRAVDDLYALGAPVGEGGPWKDTAITAGQPSDPLLDDELGRQSMTLDHDGDRIVRFTIEADFLADGSWKRYMVIEVPAGQQIAHRFPGGYAAHWLHVTADYTGKASAWLTYEA